MRPEAVPGAAIAVVRQSRIRAARHRFLPDAMEVSGESPLRAMVGYDARHAERRSEARPGTAGGLSVTWAT